MRTWKFLFGLAICAFWSGAGSVSAQVLIITDQPLPRPGRPTSTQSTYEIQELEVRARLVDQVARVNVAQTFKNTGRSPIEVSFIFPLPYDGAIDRLTLMVDGKELPAKLLPKDEARRKYEEIVRRCKDPALLEWMGTGLFQTSVFPVPAGAERQVTLHYNQLLRKDHQLTDFLFPLSTAKYSSQPVEKITVQVTLESQLPIKSIYSPTHSIDVRRSGEKQATVIWTGKRQVPTTDFRLFYDVEKGDLGASVLSYRPDRDEDGYFLLLASPQIKAPDAERPRKTVLFVVDRSGSMAGEKIEQARSALKFVLENLREGDLFNIITYESSVESFRPELQRYSDETRKQALGFVAGLYAGGGTNIEGALKSAFAQLQDKKQPSYVIFLTDGLPTVGERSEAKIAVAARRKNDVRARLFTFGVGYDVNSRLLDRLARDNFGQSEYVRPDEDIEAHVSRVYNRISSPVLTDVAVQFEFDELRSEEGSPINRRYPDDVHDLFEGEQLVILGRYRKPGAVKVVIRGTVGDETQSFDFGAKLTDKSHDQSYAFVAKLWAMRRIGEILDQLDLHGKNEELTKELVELSTRHGILTPYTSFLADESAPMQELADVRLRGERAQLSLRRLSEVEGRSGVAQRTAKEELRQAFQVQTPTPAAGLEAGAYGLSYRNIDTDKEVTARGMRIVSGKPLYGRGKLWFTLEAAEFDPIQDKEQIQTVERFTPAYFQLIRENSPEENQILSSQQPGEELLVKLRGKAYLIK